MVHTPLRRRRLLPGYDTLVTSSTTRRGGLKPPCAVPWGITFAFALVLAVTCLVITAYLVGFVRSCNVLGLTEVVEDLATRSQELVGSSVVDGVAYPSPDAKRPPICGPHWDLIGLEPDYQVEKVGVETWGMWWYSCCYTRGGLGARQDTPDELC